MKLKYLYKYRRFDKHTEKIFTKTQLWFTHPDDLNDLYELSIPVSYEGTDENYYKAHYEHYKKEYPKASDEYVKELAKRATRFGKHRDTDFMRKMEREDIEEARQTFGVCCFSEKNNDSLLMWAHYAEGHQGFCLEFDATFPFFREALKVTYTKILPQVNRFNNSVEEIVKARFLTKSHKWRYEKEWRIFGKQGVHYFPEQSLVGVVFGRRMTLKNKSKIIKWLKNRKSPLQIYETKRKENVFDLDIMPIKNFIDLNNSS